jgi:hypothetical protein
MQQPQQQKALDDRESLRNLDGIYVDVGVIPSLAVAQKLSAEGLKEDVERQLQRANVLVLEMGHFRTGDPHLEVVVTTSAAQNRMVASLVELNFVQICFMRRNPAVTFNRARTWNASATVSLGPAATLASRIRSEVARQVEQFIAAYRVVNQ